MSLLTFHGFEFGSLTEGLTTSGTRSIQSGPTYVKTGDFAFKVSPATTGTGYGYLQGHSTSAASAAFDVATLYASWDFLWHTKPTANDECIAQAHDGTVFKCELRLNSSGNLALYDSTETLLGTGTAILAADTQYRIDLKCGTGASSTEYEVRVDGVSDITGSAGNLGTTNNNRFYIGKVVNRNGNGIECYYDNVFVDNAAYVSTAAIVTRMAPTSGTPTYDAFSIGSGGGDKYTNLVETGSPNSDTSYLLGTTTLGDAQTVPVETAAGAGITGTVLGVKFTASLQSLGAGASDVQMRVRSATTDYDSITFTQSTSIAIRMMFYLTDPATAAAWTTAGLDDVEIGIEQRDTVDPIGWYAGFLMVGYVPAATAAFARPSSDVAGGNWLNEADSGTNLYASIDEETANDTDYIISGATPTDDACTIKLSNVTTPQSGTVTMRVRAKWM